MKEVKQSIRNTFELLLTYFFMSVCKQKQLDFEYTCTREISYDACPAVFRGVRDRFCSCASNTFEFNAIVLDTRIGKLKIQQHNIQAW